MQKKQTLKTIQTQAKKEIEKVANSEQLEKARVKFLGRKSELNLILKGLKDLSKVEKKVIGPLANQARSEISELINAKQEQLEAQETAQKEWIDVTAPGTKNYIGHANILFQTQKDIEDIFISLGFEIADGPEIENEWFNFTAVNMPPSHPARDMQDTFWLKENSEGQRLLPRTHTSNVQVRYMKKNTPPFRIIIPGRCFRNEATDTSHEHTFYQFEALVVGDTVSVANFKSIAKTFFSAFFGQELEIRLRSSYFPFTEPSFEFDISCTVCGGKGCSSCQQSGWLEVGGCGMVNQKVFQAADYPKGKYQGFAWGFGIERLAMMKHKIDDIRHFKSGDLRFVRQF